MNGKTVVRRQVLQSMLGAAGAGAAGYWLSKRSRKPELAAAPLVSRNLSVPADERFPVMAVATGGQVAETVRLAVRALGGIHRFVSRGDVVVVKPNAAWDRTPEQAANTNPELVGELVRLCLEAGARKVLVADVPVNDAQSTYVRSGIGAATRGAGGELIYPEERLFREVNLQGEVLTEWPVLQPFLEADKLINVPVAKHHSLTRVTLGLKNLYGVIGGQRHRLHQRIHESLADLAGFLRPTLTVMDCWRVLLRNGPSGGSLADVAVRRTIAVSTDPVAADAWAAATIWGLPAASLPYLGLAAARGIGTPDYEKVKTQFLTA